MRTSVLKKSYCLPPIDKKEVLRYAGAHNIVSSELNSILTECIKLSNDKLRADVCYIETDFRIDGSTVIFDDLVIKSDDLSKLLKDKNKCIIFAATIGVESDRMVAKYGRISPARALVYQAIGAERVEQLCDMFCDEYIKKSATIRKSPGYGDIPLDCQTDLINLLDASRKIGLTVNTNLMLSPTKSVTAFFGINM